MNKYLEGLLGRLGLNTGSGLTTQAKYDDLLAHPNIEVQNSLASQGIDPYGRYGSRLMDRLGKTSSNNQSVFAQPLYDLYTKQGDGNAFGDVGSFWKNFIDQATNPSLGSSAGFSPAKTYSDAMALAGRALDPTSGLRMTSNIIEAVQGGNNDDIFTAVEGTIIDAGVTAFSDRDMQMIDSRLQRIKSMFDRASYNGDFKGNFLEYLGTVGARMIQDLLPGLDLGSLSSWGSYGPDSPAVGSAAVPKGTDPSGIQTATGQKTY